VLERGFASQAAEGTSGLVYMGARHYDPATGRFLQADPLGIEASELYAYAGNNPYAYWDPTGLAPFSVSAGGWGATGNFGLGNPLVTSASYQGTIEAASPPSLAGVPAYIGRFGLSGVSRLYEDRAIGNRGAQEQAAFAGDGSAYYEAAAASRRNAIAAYLTDPVNLALTAVTLGEGLAVRAGVGLAARAGPLSSAYRYVGSGEASIIEKSGLVPNVTRLGQPKNVSLTPLEYRSASQAEEALAIGRFDPRGPGITPTHGVEVDLRGVPLSYGGTGATGVGGIEVQTPAAVRALRIFELEP